jgi:hemolysin activation/secretion protein
VSAGSPYQPSRRRERRSPRRIGAGARGVAFTLAFVPIAVGAQVPPALDPGQLLRQQEGQRPAVPPRDDAPPVRTPAVPTTPDASPAGGPTVLVRSWTIEGANRIPASELEGRLADLVGRSLDYAELRAAAERVALLYRERGFFLAQVVLPAQDVTEGRLRLQVIEGRLAAGADAIRIRGASRLDPSVAERVLRAAIGAERNAEPVLRRAELERGVLLLNDLPGVAASVVVVPGSAPGTSGLEANVRETPLARGTVSFDNLGNRYTGANRVGLAGSLENPTGRGDRLALNGLTALDGRFNYGRAGYTRPLGSTGLRAELYGSMLEYAAGRELSALRSEGTAQTFGAGLRYPLVRGRLANVSLVGNAERKRLTTDTLDVNVADKRVTTLPLGVVADAIDRLGGGGVTSGYFTLVPGRLDLGGNAGALATDAAGPRADGSFLKALVGVTRLQSLTDSAVLQASLTAQKANGNLDPSEKLAVGGPLGVRAYPAGEGLGDDGAIGTVELRQVLARGLAPAGLRLGDAQLGLFYDHGWLRQYTSLWSGASLTGPNTYALRGAGVALNLGSAGRFDFRLQWATKIGSNPGATATGADSDGGRGRSRVSVVLNVHF